MIGVQAARHAAGLGSNSSLARTATTIIGTFTYPRAGQVTRLIMEEIDHLGVVDELVPRGAQLAKRESFGPGGYGRPTSRYFRCIIFRTLHTKRASHESTDGINIPVGRILRNHATPRSPEFVFTLAVVG